MTLKAIMYLLYIGNVDSGEEMGNEDEEERGFDSRKAREEGNKNPANGILCGRREEKL